MSYSICYTMQTWHYPYQDLLRDAPRQQRNAGFSSYPGIGKGVSIYPFGIHSREINQKNEQKHLKTII
ncbi:hypothetical protein [Vibrio campbellii]|uniref:hypothetical protein n=1 Tax=Vibrio campbellii TaxID=680 RepID=UPI001267AB99|nr:hypothetical protein [Vibrio campbellii]HBC3421925.1 hypothetical protein [Vibrio parahaemolyticus]HBC3883727.1 hypothetical protein [Vibrio parahaemolyticus]HBC3907991.1 hypothetical protein [Vibrio parahaemolyticus]